jgi:opacity protein-like surface antigen
MMTKSGRIFIIFLFLWGCLASPEVSAGLTFDFKLSAGANFLAVGDLNRDIDGTNNFYKDYTIATGMSPMEGGFKKIQYGFEFEGDLLILLSPKFGLSIGSGFLQGEVGRDKSRAVVYYPDYTRTDEMEVRLNAVPIKIGAYFFVPISSKGRLFFNGGVGYYIAQYRKQFWSEWGTADWENWLRFDEKAKGENIGFHGGLGLEYAFSRKMALFVEGFARYAKIKELNGHQDWTPSWLEGTIKTEGKLYYYEWRDHLTRGWYSAVELDDSPLTPSTSLRNIRAANCVFSGFSIRVGFKLTL